MTHSIHYHNVPQVGTEIRGNTDNETRIDPIFLYLQISFYK